MSRDDQRKQWLARLPLWLLALAFLGSALAKLASIGSFERYLLQQELAASLPWAAYEARLVIAGELFLGLAFCQRAWVRRVLLPVTIVMLVIFSGFLVHVRFVVGDTGSCHCFGDLMPMGPIESLIKNLVLLGICAWGWRATRHWSPGRWPWPIVLLLGALAFTFVVSPPQLGAGIVPADGDLADDTPSRFARFSEFSTGTVDLTEGTKVVSFVSMTCEHCMEITSEMVEAHADGRLPQVYVVCMGSEMATLDFQAQTGSTFPYLIVGPEVFFDYIGDEPPRVYLLRDGHPAAAWDLDTFAIDDLVQRVNDAE